MSRRFPLRVAEADAIRGAVRVRMAPRCSAAMYVDYAVFPNISELSRIANTAPLSLRQRDKKKSHMRALSSPDYLNYPLGVCSHQVITYPPHARDFRAGRLRMGRRVFRLRSGFAQCLIRVALGVGSEHSFWRRFRLTLL